MVENIDISMYHTIATVYNIDSKPKIKLYDNDVIYNITADYTMLVSLLTDSDTIDSKKGIIFKLKKLETASLVDIAEITNSILRLLVDISYATSHYSRSYLDIKTDSDIADDIREAVILGANIFLNEMMEHSVANKIREVVPTYSTLDNSINNGGKTSYYDIPDGVKTAADIIEWRNMNFAQGEIFKAVFCFNTGRHSGTDDLREINKVIYYAGRVKDLIEYRVVNGIDKFPKEQHN
jgi:hypothetical protein